ncbi:MAG: type IV toxin-antitoxin system AbiEi family antitoxin domain-containing protein [Acidimicrobiia bacterium]|nr:type IV toxin-antitoxin system AbiEi family antitoxin domain-containing protein [Acidimicrobiia bacterium]
MRDSISTVHALLLDLLERQHGVVGYRQALDEGIGRGGFQHAIRRGYLRRVHPGIYRLAGTTATPEQSLMAACLAGGPRSAASHWSAAALWGLARAQHRSTTVVSPRWKRLKHLGIDAHESLAIDDEDLTLVSNVPVLTVERTILILGAVTGEAAVEAVLDDAIRRELTTYRSVEVCLARIAASGRNGVGVTRRVLQWKQQSPGESESLLETKAVRVIAGAALPSPTRQYEVDVGSRRLRLDLAYPAERIAIELDGRTWHRSARAFQDDRERQNLLVIDGWEILRFTWDDVTLRPEAVASTVRAALRNRFGVR